MHILRTYSHEGWLLRWHLRWRLKLIHWSNSSAVEYSILSIWILCIYLSRNIRMCVCSRGSFLKPNETTDRGLNTNPIPPVWKLFITVRNEVAKVMFLHLSVIHSVHSGHRSGRYPSYWNAYLFETMYTERVKNIRMTVLVKINHRPNLHTIL